MSETIREPVSDEFATRTATIRAWVSGDTIGTGELLAELRYWADYWGPA